MNILSKLFYLFTPYVNANERHVARMFLHLREDMTTHVVATTILSYIQRDVATLSLWSEYRYKGYDYLTKASRKRLYDNLGMIRQSFTDYCATHPLAEERVVTHVAGMPFTTTLARSQPEKLVFLASIMQYLNPRGGRYAYRASSSFGRLLEDPSKHVLEGDCNQIVTLYIYLYATRYDVSDLKLVSLPGHVSLQFCELGIETTTGSFMRQDATDARVVPVQEIVSINLLDTSDSYLQTHKVPAETVLEAARMAYLASSERQVVKANLKATYNNTVREFSEQQRFWLALKYAEQSGERRLIEMVGHNGAIYYMKRHNYDTARKFAVHADDANGLQKSIHHNEGVYYFDAGKYHEALVAFRRAGEEEMVKRCYEGLFMREQESLKNVRTVDELKAHAGAVARMRDYARKSGNTRLIEHANKLKA